MLLAAVAFGAAGEEGYEGEPVLRASEILPPELLSSDHHEVIEEVANDGYMNRFRIASDFGRYEAYGGLALAVRVREIQALAELDRLSKTDLFVGGLEASAKGTAKSVESFVKEPDETLKRLPGGVKRLFDRGARAAKKGAGKVKERIEDDEEAEIADDAADAASGAAKGFLGITAGERQWAQKLGTDPYTSNETLRQEIKKAARIASAGGLVVRIGVPLIPGVGQIRTMNAIVWSKDPQELAKHNRERLTALGAEPALAAAFFANPALSPTQQTVFVTALAALEGTEDLSLAVGQASEVENEDEARFLVESAEMLRWLHETETPVARLLPGERVLIALSAGGSEVMMAPVDYLSWTEGIAKVARRRTASPPPGAERRELYLLGGVSPRCKSELEALGWVVHDQLFSRLAEAHEPASLEGEAGTTRERKER